MKGNISFRKIFWKNFLKCAIALLVIFVIVYLSLIAAYRDSKRKAVISELDKKIEAISEADVQIYGSSSLPNRGSYYIEKYGDYAFSEYTNYQYTAVTKDVLAKTISYMLTQSAEKLGADDTMLKVYEQNSLISSSNYNVYVLLDVLTEDVNNEKGVSSHSAYYQLISEQQKIAAELFKYNGVKYPVDGRYKKDTRINFSGMFLNGGSVAFDKVEIVDKKNTEKVYDTYDFGLESRYMMTSSNPNYIVSNSEGYSIYFCGTTGKAMMYLDNSKDYSGYKDVAGNITVKNTLVGCRIIAGADFNTVNSEMKIMIETNKNMFKDYSLAILLAVSASLMIMVIYAWFISYRRFMKEQNEYEMEQYRRTMTNTMAHDLKSPLMAISGFADNLKENNNDKEKRDHYVDSIKENVEYMNSIIENILELSKREQGLVKIIPEKLDVKEAAEASIKNFTNQIEDKQLIVKVEGEATIDFDKSMSGQVFDNLIGNAVKYCPDKEVVLVLISDTQISFKNALIEPLGISDEEIVKPFVKGDNSRSGKKGTGLGLTIVKNIVEAHGYKFSVHSDDKSFEAVIELK